MLTENTGGPQGREGCPESQPRSWTASGEGGQPPSTREGRKLASAYGRRELELTGFNLTRAYSLRSGLVFRVVPHARLCGLRVYHPDSRGP